MLSLRVIGLASGVLGSLPALAATADTMSSALAAAYAANPDLDQERAATRASDEAVARAKSGYRPKATFEGSAGYTGSIADHGDEVVRGRTGPTFPRIGALAVRQKLFDGGRTTDEVRGAESDVLAARERLRQKEQSVLRAAATAYMDVLRDVALLALRKNEVSVLETRLREARARHRADEVTFTDVAEVASVLATARAGYYKAQAALVASMADYRRIIGHSPAHLAAARPVDDRIPQTLAGALGLADIEHPRIAAALHEVDHAQMRVLEVVARLYPTLDAVERSQLMQQNNSRPTNRSFRSRLAADVDVPIYSGGETEAAVREAKEKVTRAQFVVEAARAEVRATLESAWARLVASKALIASARADIKASETALIEVRAEASLGQRTTLDELIATQKLFDAQASLVTAEHDRVTGTYDVMAAVGRLSAANLGLGATIYDPTVHFRQVKDKWIGLRTPDGR